MATMTIEYNEKDIYARQVLAGLIGSGIIRRKKEEKNKRISSFKAALQEIVMMSANIAQNGIKATVNKHNHCCLTIRQNYTERQRYLHTTGKRNLR